MPWSSRVHEIDHQGAAIYQFPVASKSSSVTEEAGSVPVAVGAAATAEPKEAARGFLKAARKDLTPEEAGSPAGLRWLQYEAERLDQECGDRRQGMAELQVERESLLARYNDQRVELEKLQGGRRASIRNEILSNLCLAAGSAGLGVTPSYLSIADAAQLAEAGLAISGVLFVGGILLRMWK
jgi:hypothetical protein